MKRQNVRTLSLIVVTFTYLLLGAAIFDAFESEFEGKEETRLREHAEILRAKYNITVDDFERITQLGIQMKPYKAGTQWKFAGAFYFATTVITTIGYGHSTPKTTGGKIFCMCYAVPGIPLCLVMFQSIGERMNTIITYLLRKTNHLLKLRKSVSQTKLMIVSFTIGSTVLTIGAAMFSRYEDWGYLDSFYYCFITLTTIGFGDFVALQRNDSLARRPDYVAFSLIFILFGLTVVSSVMNLLVLRFLTMNTEDERRDQLEAAVYAHELKRLRGDVIWPSAEKLTSTENRLSMSNQDLLLAPSTNRANSIPQSDSVSSSPPICSRSCCSICIKHLWSSSIGNLPTSGSSNCSDNKETRKVSSTLSNECQPGHKTSTTTAANNNPTVIVDCDGQSHCSTVLSLPHVPLSVSTPRLDMRKFSVPTGYPVTHMANEMFLPGHNLENTISVPIDQECPCVSLILKQPEPCSLFVERTLNPDGQSTLDDGPVHVLGGPGIDIGPNHHQYPQRLHRNSYPRQHEVGYATIRRIVVDDLDSVFESAPIHYMPHEHHNHFSHLQPHPEQFAYECHIHSHDPQCPSQMSDLYDSKRHFSANPGSHVVSHHCPDLQLDGHDRPFWELPVTKLIYENNPDETSVLIDPGRLVHANECIYPDENSPPLPGIRRRAST